MAIDFPTSPTLNQTFSVGNTNYVWDGTKWTASVTGGIALDKIEEGNTSAEVVDTGSDGRFVVTTEGVEALRVDASQRLGIGTSSPGNMLHIEGASPSIRLKVTSGPRHMISPFSGDLYIESDPDNTSASTNTIFTVDGTERVRIDSSGRVGIGISAPGSNLHIAGGNAPVVAQVGSTAGGETGAVIYHGTGTKYNWRIGAQQTADNAFEFARSTNVGGTTFNSPYLLINSSGNVGIGTTSPGATLHTKITAAQSNISVFESAGGTLVVRTHSAGGGEAVFNAYQGSSSTTPAPIVFQQAGNEKFRCDSSGRLLVGTSSASSSATLQLQGNTSSATAQPSIFMRRGSAPGSSDALGYLIFGDSNENQGAYIGANRDGGTWTSGSSHPSRLVFSTTPDSGSSPVERMRISNNGTLSVYGPADSPSVNFSVSHGPGTHQSLAIYSGGSSTTSLGTKQFYVQNNGDVRNTNNSYGAISDVKLKENIIDANSQWNDLKALQVRNYNFKEETGHQTHTQLGLIAQEVELVSPGLVSESPDRDEDGNDLGTVTKSVNYSVLYMKAVKALQEAMERIETLEAKVAALESA